jgi:hypothetical protein
MATPVKAAQPPSTTREATDNVSVVTILLMLSFLEKRYNFIGFGEKRVAKNKLSAADEEGLESKWPYLLRSRAL